jgi:hypothetical protein
MTPKHPLESRTTLFGFAVVLLAALELAQDHLPVLLVDLAPKTNAWITLGIGVAIIVLRFITSAPLTWKPDDHV